MREANSGQHLNLTTEAPRKGVKSASNLDNSFQAEDIRVTCEEEDYQVQELDDFRDACFPDVFYEIFNQLKFVKPTPIQKYAIPIALDCRDLIGIAKTGSGKTLAFMLPAVQAILDEKNYYWF